MHIREEWNGKLLSDLGCAFLDRVADGTKTSALYLPVSKKFGVSLCDTPAANKCEIKHGLALMKK
jgi:hypothetical protein